MSELLEKLRAPFDPARVSWRVGSTTQDKAKGMALAYIDSRDVQDRLDAVCGPEGWQDRYPHVGTKTVCEIGVKIGDAWIWKSDGAGDSDVEAEKGALSDAFKRAAVKWGIGRYLYDMDSPWVAIEQKGKSYAITAQEMKRLQNLLAPKTATDAHMQKVAIKLEGAPQAERPWTGPLKTTELKKQLTALAADVKACTDGDQISALIGSAFEILKQAHLDLPQWYDAGKVSIKQRGEELKEDLSRWFHSIEKPAQPTQNAAE